MGPDKKAGIIPDAPERTKLSILKKKIHNVTDFVCLNKKFYNRHFMLYKLQKKKYVPSIHATIFLFLIKLF